MNDESYYGRVADALAEAANEADPDARWRVVRMGDPQPPTCAECQDERWVCDRFGHGLCRDPRCVVNRRPCPSCAPTEPGDA